MIGSRWRKIFHFALDSAVLWMVASVAIGMVASLLPARAAGARMSCQAAVRRPARRS